MFIIGEFLNLFVFAMTVYVRFFLVFIMWGLLFLVNKCFNFGWDCPNLAKFVVNFCLLFSRVSRFNSTIAALYERVGQIIFNAINGISSVFKCQASLPHLTGPF